MSHSWFPLLLDTIGPSLTITISPTIIIVEGDILLNIVGSEAFNPELYTVYLTDSNGVRHDIILNIVGEEAEAILSIRDYPIGLITLTIIMRDEVSNPSDIVTRHLYILATDTLACIIGIDNMDSDISIINNRIILHIGNMESELESITNKTILQVGNMGTLIESISDKSVLSIMKES